jgi:hypothetical protein
MQYFEGRLGFVTGFATFEQAVRRRLRTKLQDISYGRAAHGPGPKIYHGGER